jgi:L-2,4-diaminobutyrate transaminase
MGDTRKLSEELSALDRRAWLHPFTPVAEHLERGPELLAARAEGVHVYDVQGRRYLDAMAGLWCVNVGYGREEIVRAIAEQARRLPFAHAFAGSASEPAVRLAARLADLAPVRCARVFFGTSGSDANETLIKTIWYYNNLRGRPAKKKILSRRRAYHGVTLGAGSATGLGYVHNRFDLPLERFIHLRAPHFYREGSPGTSEREFVASLARELEETIEREGADTVAAFFAEPVMGAGGVIVPPDGYFDAILPVLRRHDVLLAVDEVICGFGRLGAWFGSERYGLAPDLMSLAKGITSGYVPMSACVISGEIFETLRERSADTGAFSHGYTYSGHPVAAAAALANLDVLEAEKLVEKAARVGGHLQGALREELEHHPLVGEVRGEGMMAGVELVADRGSRTPFDSGARAGRRLASLLLEEGMLVRALGDTIALSPPLVLESSQAEEIVALLARGLDRLASALRREGVRFG